MICASITFQPISSTIAISQYLNHSNVIFSINLFTYGKYISRNPRKKAHLLKARWFLKVPCKAKKKKKTPQSPRKLACSDGRENEKLNQKYSPSSEPGYKNK